MIFGREFDWFEQVLLQEELEQRVEQIWNRYFQYICSVLNPIDFQDFLPVFDSMEQMVQM